MPDELARRWATRTLVTAAISVPRGPWTTAADRPAGAFALLVLRGALLAELSGSDHVSARLAGPGDVIAPWADGDDSLQVPTAWRALEPAALAVLDERFTQVSQRCPALALALVQRMTDCAARDAHLVAALQARRIERRILGLFWHMADRWGTVGTDGVTVSVRATHETLGRLAGAQRSTVTLALRDLSESGMVQRLPDGRWRLAPDSRMLLEAG